MVEVTEKLQRAVALRVYGHSPTPFVRRQGPCCLSRAATGIGAPTRDEVGPAAGGAVSPDAAVWMPAQASA